MLNEDQLSTFIASRPAWKECLEKVLLGGKGMTGNLGTTGEGESSRQEQWPQIKPTLLCFCCACRGKHKLQACPA